MLSLFIGGFAFLAPIHATGAFPVILSNIPPNDNPPQVVVAALRAAINIAEVTALALPASAANIAELADIAFVEPSLLEAFRDVLTAPVTSHMLQTQQNLVAKLISLLCREERHQIDLADSGILDALATNLASVIVARGYVIPEAEAIAQREGVSDLIPGPAPHNTDVTAILEALSAIIGDSRWRASLLVYSPAMLTVFPKPGSPRRSKAFKACASSFEAAGLSRITAKELGAMDCFLPLVPEYQVKAATFSHFPPLGPSPPKDHLNPSRAPSLKWISSSLTWEAEEAETFGSNPEGEVEDMESPLIPWLIHTARSSDGIESVMAAAVATSLFKSGFVNKSRETYMGRLIVPILLQTLEDIGPASGYGEATFTDTETITNRTIVERSLAVLANLVIDSDFLEKCAFDCSGIKIASSLLKSAYEPVPSQPSRPWSPTPHHEKNGRRDAGLLTSRLGTQGLSPILAHRIRVREIALKVIAAMAGKDDYAKAFVEQDVVPFIVESLSATPTKPTKDLPVSPKIFLGSDSTEIDPAYGANPTTVIIAACHALRVFSRSVSILRTTLQDSGVQSPAFRLLRHPDIEVQIAASGLMCNLVTSLSPMRVVSIHKETRSIWLNKLTQSKKRLDEVGVMGVLCDKASSQNPVLRLNAIWALKNWVEGADIKAKKQCVEELTPGLLVRLIREDTEDDALYQRTAKNEKQAANDMDEDVEMAQAVEDNRTSVPSLLQNPPDIQSNARTPRLRQAEEKVAELRNIELSPVRKVRDDDLAIQEQGLRFLQNLIGPIHQTTDSPRDHADMIDYLFTVFDQDRFFEIMHSKLQLKVLHPFGRRYANNRQDSRVLYPQARIVSAVVYILVHIAANLPRHRQILISQTKLLTDLGKQFQSKDKEVRVALCHLMTSLTGRDDPDDEASSLARAGELKKLGLLTKLEALERDDGELDVRERAKEAMWHMKPRRS